MSDHLSQDQFAKCAVGAPGEEELRHLKECALCTAERDRFGDTLSMFRTSVRERIDARVALQPLVITSFKPGNARIPAWRWALVAAGFVVVVLLPFFLNETQPPQTVEQTPDPASAEAVPASAEAVMDRVNFHLSRTVPASMEPAMALIPSDVFASKPGGVQ